MKYIVIAEQEEQKLIEELFAFQQDVEKEWASAEVLIAGVGALNIMQSLRALPIEAEILNVGYAGSANYPIGSWKCVGEVRLNHPNVDYKEPVFALQTPSVGEWETARCFTSIDFVLQSKETDCVFDMELAFICGMGFRRVTAYKKVSDNLSLHEYHETGGFGVV